MKIKLKEILKTQANMQSVKSSKTVKTTMCQPKVIVATALLTVLSGFYAFLSSQQGYAQTATDSATEINVDLIKERLQKSNVMGSQTDVKKHAVVGEVQRVTSEAITIKTTNGATNILPIQEVALLNEDEEAITVESFVIDNWATALGYIDEENAFVPHFIIAASSSLAPAEHYISLSTITSATTQKLTISPRNAPDESKDITISRDTTIEDSEGQVVAVSDLEEDLQILVVGIVEDDKITANTIRLLAPLSQENE